MNGLYITVDGVVGTEPKKSAWNGSPILSFRLVANERRYDKLRNTWVDVHASWVTVSCFRDLARNVEASIRKGDRLIVHGKARVKDFTGDDGLQRTVVTLEADSIGHNLIFGTSRFRPTRSGDSAEAQIRAQADELIRELSAEPSEDVGALLAQRAAEDEAETGPDDFDLDDDPDEQYDQIEPEFDTDQEPADVPSGEDTDQLTDTDRAVAALGG